MRKQLRISTDNRGFVTKMTLDGEDIMHLQIAKARIDIEGGGGHLLHLTLLPGEMDIVMDNVSVSGLPDEKGEPK